MAFDIGELKGSAKIDATQAKQALDQLAAAAKQASNAMDSSMKQAGQSADELGKGADRAGTAVSGLGTKIKGLVAAAAGFAAGAALVDFLRDSVTAASDLNETLNKSSVIFGDSAGEIEAWGETAAESVGLSKAAALEAAANFGNMFTQLGFTADAAADLSTQVVQMAADLGSFNNLPTADVADRISAAFRGEYDALQLLIPNISAARVEQEALALSGKTSADALTAQEKATAVLAIVQRDGAAAMGDFARTSGEFANSQKIAAAELENTKAAIGEKLLPVAQALLDLFQNVGIPVIEGFAAAIEGIVGTVADLPGPLLLAAAAIGGWMLFGQISGLVTAFAAAVGKAGTAVKGFIASLGPVGLLIAGVTTAMSFLMDTQNASDQVLEQNAERWDRLAGTLDKATGAITNATRAQLVQETQSSGMLDTLEQLGVSTETFIDASLGVVGAQDKLGAAVQSATDRVLDQSSAYQEIEGALRNAGVSQKEFVDAVASGDWSSIRAEVQSYAEAVARSTGNTSDATNIMAAFDAAVQGTAGPLGQLAGVMNLAGADAGDFATAAGDAEQAQRAMGDAGTAAAGGVEAAGEAAADSTSPMEDLAAATKDMSDAAGEADSVTNFLIATLERLNGGVVSAGTAVRANESAFRDMAAAQREVQAAQDGIIQADLDLAAAQAEVNRLANEGITSGTEYTEAQLALSDAQRGVADAAAGVDEAMAGFAEAQIAARDGAVGLAASLFEQAGGFNNVDAATAAMVGSLEASKQAWIDAQPEADRLSGAAQRTADALFNIPAVVATTLSETGAQVVTDAANGTAAAVNGVPESKNTGFTETGARVVASESDIVRAAIEAIPDEHNTGITETGSRVVASESDIVRQAIDAIPDSNNTALSQTGAQAATGQANTLEDAVNAIPDSNNSSLTQTGAQAATSQANTFTAAINNIPPGKNSALATLGAATAAAQAHSVTAAVNSIPSTKSVNINVFTTGVAAAQAAVANLLASVAGGASGGSVGRIAGMPGFAAGGEIPGFAPGGQLPGRRPFDSMLDNLLGLVDGKTLIGLQSGEWIMRNKAVDYYGPEFMKAVNALQYRPTVVTAGGATRVDVYFHGDGVITAEMARTAEVVIDAEFGRLRTDLVRARQQR